MRFKLPVADSLKDINAASLTRDISAGFAIAAVALPSAIAYPAIAGLPPETGIYASIAPLIGYALFGPSRRLMTGPDAATMALIAAVIGGIVASMNVAVPRVEIAAALAIMVGLIYLAASALRLGVLANFLSRPILIGFLSGVSLSILVGQIGRFTGVSIDAEGLVPPVWEILGKAGLISWPSVMLGLAMFAILQAARYLKSPIPGAVIVVAVSIVLSWAFDFSGIGIAVVGAVPAGLPAISFPTFTGYPLEKFVLGAAAIFLVSFGAGIVTARSFAARAGESVEPNRELVGFGAANLCCGFFSGFPVTASDSRTAINFSTGGSSQIAGLIAAAALTAILLFFNDAIRILPIPALGAILAAAAISLIDINGLWQVWRVNRMEFIFALIALWGPISLGVLNGVIISVAATLVYLLSKGMYPRDAMLGRIPGRDGFYKLHRTPQARPIPGIAICLIQGNLVFFSADHVRDRLFDVSRKLPSDTKWFILDASAIVQTDYTAVEMLKDVCRNLQ
jgi:SulP family sulfate permease